MEEKNEEAGEVEKISKGDLASEDNQDSSIGPNPLKESSSDFTVDLDIDASLLNEQDEFLEMVSDVKDKERDVFQKFDADMFDEFDQSDSSEENFVFESGIDDKSIKPNFVDPTSDRITSTPDNIDLKQDAGITNDSEETDFLSKAQLPQDEIGGIEQETFERETGSKGLDTAREKPSSGDPGLDKFEEAQNEVSHSKSHETDFHNTSKPTPLESVSEQKISREDQQHGRSPLSRRHRPKRRKSYGIRTLVAVSAVSILAVAWLLLYRGGDSNQTPITPQKKRSVDLRASMEPSPPPKQSKDVPESQPVVETPEIAVETPKEEPLPGREKWSPPPLSPEDIENDRIKRRVERKIKTILSELTTRTVFYPKDIVDQFKVKSKKLISDTNAARLAKDKLTLGPFEEERLEDELLSRMILVVTAQRVETVITDIEDFRKISGENPMTNIERETKVNTITQGLINSNLFHQEAIRQDMIPTHSEISKRRNQYIRMFPDEADFEKWIHSRYGTIDHFNNLLKNKITEERLLAKLVSNNMSPGIESLRSKIEIKEKG